ncbi:MAG: transglycosylase domain-containing protein [Bdellovibrionales bacterium]
MWKKIIPTLKLAPWRKIIPLFCVLSLLAIGVFLIHADRQLQSRLEQGWFLPPVEFYTAPQTYKLEQKKSALSLANRFRRWGWRQREAGQPVLEGDFALLNAVACRQQVPQAEFSQDLTQCLGFWAPGKINGRWMAFNGDIISGLYGLNGDLVDAAEIPGERFAQYYKDQPILRTVVDLGAVPLYCAQAVTAIEDSDFLTHRGISLTAILRAIGRNVSQARFAEGASTITQQLVKNYFLTSEKTLRRKLTEQAMAVLLELRVDKDQILSNYLNVTYMGQHGSFQVLGFAAAAEHYFDKNLNALNLSECALLAAIINNPGRYNPIRQPEHARTRRALVLSRMQQLDMISEDERAAAEQTPLGAKPNSLLSEPAPYFVQAVLEEIRSLGISAERGLKIQTTLDPELQERAQVVVAKQLAALEVRIPKLKTISKAPLQGAALMVDVHSGGVRALVGGRQYKQNQFNRIRSSRRQPGSLFKPFVYLAALESGDYTPETRLLDEPWTYRYEGQSWTPRNYDKQFRGQVTMTQALAESLNIPTARLGIDVGLASVAELAGRLGVQSALNPLPALSLGAAEVTPWELTEAYLTLARGGERMALHLINQVTTSSGEELFTSSTAPERVVREEPTLQLTQMMQETFVSGTAKALARALEDTPDRPAGKTGTTSDTRDAWFAGFNHDLLTLTWVGFDDNTSTGLTGAGAALPIWFQLQYGR